MVHVRREGGVQGGRAGSVRWQKVAWGTPECNVPPTGEHTGLPPPKRLPPPRAHTQEDERRTHAVQCPQAPTYLYSS